jgi:SAM-dependent methyltransferase
VAERDGLEIALVEADMRDLSALSDASFDCIVHPCSNCFVPDVEPVWRESYRVLKHGGVLLSGFLQPAMFLFDAEKYDRGELEVRHPLPYSDLESISEEERSKYTAKRDPLCFSHTLETLLGGQIEAGFALTGFFEDVFAPQSGDALSKYMSTFIATRASKR